MIPRHTLLIKLIVTDRICGCLGNCGCLKPVDDPELKLVSLSHGCKSEVLAL